MFQVQEFPALRYSTMETTDLPIQESVVHTMSEHADDNPHVILTADSDQSEYTRRIEKRLAELERTVERLVLEKVKLAKSEEITDVSSRIIPLNHAGETNENGGGRSQQRPGIRLTRITRRRKK